MAYTKGILERFSADIPNQSVQLAFENAITSIQFETKAGVKWCVDDAVEQALRGTAAEQEIHALRARVKSYISAEDLKLTESDL